MAGALPAKASPKGSLDFDADALSGAVVSSPDAGGAPHGSGGNGRRLARSLVIKGLCVLGGAFLLKHLTKTTTRRDHARIVAQTLSGEKFSTEQAARDPMTYFNLRYYSAGLYPHRVAFQLIKGKNPMKKMRDILLPDSAVASVILRRSCNAFWRTPERPYRQRFYMVKPCQKEMKCDVEVASYAVRDIEEYRNYCDRPKNQRPQPVEVVGDMAEHLTTVYLSKCERGRRCLYEGSTPPGGFPNSWNGATRCTSELTIFKSGEIHCWDRAYDDEGKQVWGVRQGPYEFKPGNSSTSGIMSETDLMNSLQQKDDKSFSNLSSS